MFARPPTIVCAGRTNVNDKGVGCQAIGPLLIAPFAFGVIYVQKPHDHDHDCTSKWIATLLPLSPRPQPRPTQPRHRPQRQRPPQRKCLQPRRLPRSCAATHATNSSPTDMTAVATARVQGLTPKQRAAAMIDVGSAERSTANMQLLQCALKNDLRMQLNFAKNDAARLIAARLSAPPASCARPVHKGAVAETRQKLWQSGQLQCVHLWRPAGWGLRPVGVAVQRSPCLVARQWCAPAGGCARHHQTPPRFSGPSPISDKENNGGSQIETAAWPGQFSMKIKFNYKRQSMHLRLHGCPLLGSGGP